LLTSLSSAHYQQNDEGHQIEKHYPYLVNAHAGVVEGVKVVRGQTKPFAVEVHHKIVRKDEH
jgi:hypothetical protein